MLIASADWARFTHRGEELSRYAVSLAGPCGSLSLSHYAVSLAGPWSQWDPHWDQTLHLFSVPSAAFLLCNLVLAPPCVSKGLGNWKTLFSLCISRT